MEKLKILESFVPKLVVDRILRNQMSPEPFVETYDCAVALADISGFTPLTERLASEKPAGAGMEQLSRVLNSYFGEMIHLIHSYGGDVIKFAGDALLVVFRNTQQPQSMTQALASLSKSPRTHATELPWREQVRSFHSSNDPSLSPPPTPCVSPPRFGTMYSAASFSPIPGFKDEATDVCMRCEEPFKGIGPRYRSCCSSCGCTSCSRCCATQVFEIHQRQLVSVCDDCHSSSRLISRKKWTLRQLLKHPEDRLEDLVFASDSQEDNGIRNVLLRCIQSCLEMQRNLNGLHGLRLHIGIGTGSVNFLHVGGAMGRWEFLIAGTALSQMSVAESCADVGEVCCSHNVWSLVASQCHAVNKRKDKGVVALLSVADPPPPIVVHSAIENLLTMGDSMDCEQVILDHFIRYVPGCIRDHMELAGQNRSGLLGELRTATVLFVNLPSVDYSASPEMVLSSLQEAMVMMQKATYKYEGAIRQFIMDDKGTTMIIVFGLYPFAHENDPLLAVRCAATIHHDIKHAGMSCKIGLTTGTVYAGVVGSTSRCEYAVIGDTVNLAARLMGAACNMRDIDILCDETSYLQACVGHEFVLLPRSLTVKGKRKPIKVYRPVSNSHFDSKRSAGIPSKKCLIGHSEALLSVQNVIRDKKSGVVVVEGVLGLGKSHVVSESVAQCELPETLSVVTIEGISSDQSIPCRPFYPLLRQIVETIIGGDSDFSSLKKKLMSLVAIDGTSDLLDCLDHDTVLNDLLKNIFPDLEQFDCHEEQMQEVTHSTVQQFTCLLLVLYLESQREQGLTCVIVVDSAQWLDTASWDVVHCLSRRICHSEWKLALIIVMRSVNETTYEQVMFSHERSKLLSLLPDITVLELQPLDREQTASMLSKLEDLPTRSIHDDVVDYIYKRTMGVPLYIEQVLAILHENGDLERSTSSNRCQLALRSNDSSSTRKLPSTLQSIMTCRIDKLSPSHQWLLKVASVIGESGITEEMLQFLVNDDSKADDVSQQILYLQHRGLLRLEQPFDQDVSTMSYSFTTAIREAAYELLLYTQRRHLHSLAADYLDKKRLEAIDHKYHTVEWYKERSKFSKTGLSNLYASIGHHRLKAQQYDDCLLMLRKALDVSLSNFNYVEIIQLIKKVLSIDQSVCQATQAVLSENDIQRVLYSDLFQQEGPQTIDITTEGLKRGIILHRQIADAYFSTASSELALLHFRTAICFSQHMMEKNPTALTSEDLARSDARLSLTWNKVSWNVTEIRTLLQSIKRNQKRNKPDRMEIATELSITYLWTAQTTLSLHLIQTSLLCVRQSIRYAKMNPSSTATLAEALSLLSILLRQIHGNTSLVDHCHQLSQSIALQSGCPRTIGIVDLSTSVHEASQGRWHRNEREAGAENAALDSIRTFQSLQDAVQLEKAQILLISTLRYQGKFRQALSLLGDSYRSCLNRRDIRGQINMIIQRALVNEVIDYKAFCDDLNSCRLLEMSLLEALPKDTRFMLDVLQSHQFWIDGTLQVRHYYYYFTISNRLQQAKQFWTLTKTALGYSYLPFSVIPVFGYVVDLALSVVSMKESPFAETMKKSKLRELCLNLLGQFRVLSKHYPIARSEYKRFRGKLAAFDQNAAQAGKKWNESQKAAEQLHMRFQLGLIHEEMFRNTKQAEHYSVACKMFHETGACRYLERLKRAAVA